MFQGNDTRESLRHEDFVSSGDSPCGILVNDSAELTTLHSNIDGVFYTGIEALPGISRNAAICVVSPAPEYIARLSLPPK